MVKDLKQLKHGNLSEGALQIRIDSQSFCTQLSSHVGLQQIR